MVLGGVAGGFGSGAATRRVVQVIVNMGGKIDIFKRKQDRQSAYNVTLRRVRVTSVAMEPQQMRSVFC